MALLGSDSMTRDHIGGTATNNREQLGRLLRYAYPLGLRSFDGLKTAVESAEYGRTRRDFELPPRL